MTRRFLTLFTGVTAMIVLASAIFNPVKSSKSKDLWQIYDTALKSAKYIDLTHSFSPTIPVWPGFGQATFNSASAGADIPDYIDKGSEYSYGAHGFIATAYQLPTDQYGTQLDPPAHWATVYTQVEIPIA